MKTVKDRADNLSGRTSTLSRRRLASAVAVALVAGGAAQAQDVDLSMLGDGGFAVEGAAAFDYSGRSVSGAGDVNGDGLADLIVGAPQADPEGRSGAGSSYVVFGQPDTAAIDLANLGQAGFTINGAADGGTSGSSVSGAGDVNGDGLSDVIIGAPFAEDTNAGASYVLFGKDNSTSVDLSVLGSSGFAIEGAAQQDYSGISVSGAGDVNGDGLADLIVGTDRSFSGNSSVNTSFVVFGKADSTAVALSTLPDSDGFAIRSAGVGDQAGSSVSGAGDVNGDGLADVIIGAPAVAVDGNSFVGSGYVVFGKTDGAAVDLAALGVEQGFVIEGAEQFDQTGLSVSGAGDVNGDGLADVIVGAPGGGNVGKTGRGFVVFGKSDGATVDLSVLGNGGFAIAGVNDADNAGVAVSGVGDFNGDGLADLYIGANLADPGGVISAGASYIVYGKTDAATVDLAALGNGGFVVDGANGMGSSLAGAGDVDGDGLADFIVGSERSDPGGRQRAGVSYLVFSDQTPALSARLRSRSRNGDAPRLAVGSTGDGSNNATPDARLWIDFADGADATEPASLETVTLTRTQGLLGAAAAAVNWQVESTRENWTSTELTIRYLDSELLTANEADLQLIYSANPNGPYSRLATVANPLDNTLSTVTDRLGYFFVGQLSGEISLANGATPISNGDDTPSVDDATDLGVVGIGDRASSTFTITNDGPRTLDLSGLIIVSGEDFVVEQPALTSLPATESTTFNVVFEPTQIGVDVGTVTIMSSDALNSPFEFTVTAEGAPASTANVIFRNGFE